MGFLQKLAAKAEAAIQGMEAQAAQDGEIELSYLGQTTKVKNASGRTLGDVIRDVGAEIGLSSDVNLSALGVRKAGSVVSLSEQPSPGTYYLTLAREEKA